MGEVSVQTRLKILSFILVAYSASIIYLTVFNPIILGTLAGFPSILTRFGLAILLTPFFSAILISLLSATQLVSAIFLQYGKNSARKITIGASLLIILSVLWEVAKFLFFNPVSQSAFSWSFIFSSIPYLVWHGLVIWYLTRENISDYFIEQQSLNGR